VLLLLAVAYPVVRMATGLALRPIDHMITQAADWSAHDIRHRFGRGQQFLELQTLAAHLDEVLDHLSAVVRHERQLPAELSHELRTPLARITAETDLLRVRPRSPSETEQAHAAIDAAATAMQGILDALLSTAHLEATDAPGRCPIEPVLAELTRGHANRITVRVSPKDLTAGVDEIVLRRIVAPIIDNAVRYTVHTVLISATRDDRGVVIDIQDDGPGVPAGWHARIFEPGFRGNPSDGHDGAGLGLSLARRLARAADGDVVVETVAGATRFRVLLPPG
jgi:signal transduction histidine kinase